MNWALLLSLLLLTGCGCYKSGPIFITGEGDFLVQGELCDPDTGCQHTFCGNSEIHITRVDANLTKNFTLPYFGGPGNLRQNYYVIDFENENVKMHPKETLECQGLWQWKRCTP